MSFESRGVLGMMITKHGAEINKQMSLSINLGRVSILLSTLLVLLAGFVPMVKAQTPVCATPGADGVQANPDPRNSYFPGAGENITVAAGSTSFILEGIPNPFAVGGVLYDFGNNQISK